MTTTLDCIDALPAIWCLGHKLGRYHVFHSRKDETLINRYPDVSISFSTHVVFRDEKQVKKMLVLL